MRILVLTDTHGHLKLINSLVEKHQADAVIHCGDFGIESSSRLPQTPQRELTLRIRHAPPSAKLPESAKKNSFKMTKDEKIALIKSHQLLGEFDEFLNGTASFLVPVYCIWGNHEDDLLVKQLVSKELVVPNLHLVTGSEGVLLDGWIRLVGVGGNIIHWLLFDEMAPHPVTVPSHPEITVAPSTSFYPSMRFAEWARLFERFNITNSPTTPAASKNDKHSHNPTKEQLWLVTHVSPGKEPTLEWLIFLLGPVFVFSGHMGPYLPQHYTMFTVMDDIEWLERVNKDLGFVRSVWEERKWAFQLWYFANQLLLPEENLDFQTKWNEFENTTLERQPGVKSKLTDMYLDATTLKELKEATVAKELGLKIIGLFVAQPPPEDSVNLPSSKKKTLVPFPNPTIIPTKAEFEWLSKKVEEYLVIHKVTFPKEPANSTDAFIRKPSDIVKRSPQYFNLPDACILTLLLL